MANLSEIESSKRPIHETLEEVESNLKLQLKGKTMYVPTWVGNPGIAKTAHAKLMAKKLGCKFYYVSMAKPIEFFSGLPITNTLSFDSNDKAMRDSYVHWSQPELIHKANKMSEKRDVIIFLDDLHIASAGVQSYFFELVLERSLGGHKLNKNIAIMSAMNSTIQSGFEGFYAAIMNRIQFIRVYMDFEYWYTSYGNKLNRFVALFLKVNKDGAIREEEENTKGPFATYRSWSVLSDLLNSFDEKDPEFAQKCYNAALGFVSQKTAFLFRESVVMQKRFDFQRIITLGEYNLDENDLVEQLIFSNVIRFIKTQQHADTMVKVLTELSENQNYRNAISASLFELKSYRMGIEEKTKKNPDKYGELLLTLKKLSTDVITVPTIALMAKGGVLA